MARPERFGSDVQGEGGGRRADGHGGVLRGSATASECSLFAAWPFSIGYGGCEFFCRYVGALGLFSPGTPLLGRLLAEALVLDLLLCWGCDKFWCLAFMLAVDRIVGCIEVETALAEISEPAVVVCVRALRLSWKGIARSSETRAMDSVL